LLPHGQLHDERLADGNRKLSLFTDSFGKENRGGIIPPVRLTYVKT